MTAPGEQSVPLEYSGPSNTRRGPKKLQDIGIGRFKRQGVAQHFHPNSAAGIFNKQAAEQRTEAWLRGAPVDKAKSKKKAKKVAKNKKDEAAVTTAKDAGTEGSTGNLSTGPAVAVAQMGQGKKAVDHVKSQDQTQGEASTATKAPSRKAVRIIAVPRYVKPISGTWGQRAVENAKQAAAKAVGTSYSTTPITIGQTDGELVATVIPTSKPPTPKPVVPRAAASKSKSVSTQNVTTKSASTKTVRKPFTKQPASKKPQAPMWSDNDDDEEDQDEDDLNDSLFSSRTATPKIKVPRSRTTKNSGATKAPNPRKKPTQDQPTPQKKRQVRFASTASPEEAVETTETISTTSTIQQNPQPASEKQKQQQQQQPANPPPTPYSTLNLPQAIFHVPSQPKQTPSDPAELADDEDSQILSAKMVPSAQKKTTTPIQNKKPTTRPTFTPTPVFTSTPVFTPTPSSTPASKPASKKRAEEKEEQPPRRKGVAQPPLPKRARATSESVKKNNSEDTYDDSDANDSAGPARKKAKTTVETKKSTNKSDLPARKKKGVAMKVKAKRAKPIIGDESDDDDDDSYEA
jgi:hypothetical protein